ncbi:MAG: hypothetical protein JSY10_11295 [Paenibacillus sp.]|nr:hypothetical protein [Paenibacillus sp.]
MGFPIFELPAATVFSDVVRDIMERSCAGGKRAFAAASRFQSVQQLRTERFRGIFANADGILNNPIVLLDDSNHLFLSPQAEEIVEAEIDLCRSAGGEQLV